MCRDLLTQQEMYLADAKEGSDESLGLLLESFSNYLEVLALGQMGRQLQTRLSPSDVVQDTFLEAHQGFSQFRGETIAEFHAWIRQILVNNLHRVFERHLGTQKRDVRREISVAAIAHSLDHSTARMDAIFEGRERSPSSVFAQHELQMELTNTLAKLPADYRYVLVLRHVESMSFEEVAKAMDRSIGAVRMLWLRAIKTLRESWEGESRV